MGSSRPFLSPADRDFCAAILAHPQHHTWHDFDVLTQENAQLRELVIALSRLVLKHAVEAK